MNLITIQDRLTEKAKSDAEQFLIRLFDTLCREVPVYAIPCANLDTLRKAIESNSKRELSVKYVFNQIRDALLPEAQTIFINTASKDFLAKVEAVQSQLEEIQSQLP